MDTAATLTPALDISPKNTVKEGTSMTVSCGLAAGDQWESIQVLFGRPRMNFTWKAADTAAYEYGRVNPGASSVQTTLEGKNPTRLRLHFKAIPSFAGEIFCVIRMVRNNHSVWEFI